VCVLAACLLAIRARRIIHAQTNPDPKEGALLLERAFAQVEDQPSPHALDWLLEAANAWLKVDDRVAALQTLTRACDVASARDEAACSTEWRRQRSVCQVRLGDFLQQEGRRDNALASYQSALALRKELAADPAEAPRRREHVTCQKDIVETIGDLLSQQSKWSRAVESYEEAVRITDGLLVTQNERGLLIIKVRLLRKLGDTRVALRKLNDALNSYERALTIAQELAHQDRSDLHIRLKLSVVHTRMGDAYGARGDPDLALSSFKTSRALRDEIVKADPASIEALTALVEVLHKLGTLSLGMMDVPENSSAQRCEWLDSALAIVLDVERRGRMTRELQTMRTKINQAIAHEQRGGGPLVGL
jgi:tetratricopeptide (TPR) repeat protein